MAKRSLSIGTLVCFVVVYGLGDWTNGTAGVLVFDKAEAEETSEERDTGTMAHIADRLVEKIEHTSAKASAEEEPSGEEEAPKTEAALRRWYEKKWVWIVLGVLVVGGVAAMVFAKGEEGPKLLPEPPEFP